MAALDNNVSCVFEKLTKKLSGLVYAKSNQEKVVLNNILDDLNSLNYDYVHVENNQRGILVINQCCYLVLSSEIILAKKVLLLFQNLLTKLNVSVEGKTLSLAVVWCLDCIKEEDQLLTVSALIVLRSLVRGNSKNIDDLCCKVSETCIGLTKLHRKEEPPAIVYNAFKCIEALTYSKEEESVPELLAKNYLRIIFDVLYGESVVDNAAFQCKCIIIAINALGNLSEKWCETISENSPEIIGVVKGYMLFGLPGQENYKIEKVLPTTVALPEQLKTPTSIKKVKGKYDKKSKKKNISSIADVEKDTEGSSTPSDGYTGFAENSSFQNAATTSDSDFSDGEMGFKGKLRSIQSKVRQCALILLGTLLQKGDPKVLIRYLTSLLPDGSPIPQCRTLITCLLKEPSAKCRSEVLIVLSLILSKFKPYLSMADIVSRSSYTTMSSNIANMLKELHRSLVLALLAENSATVSTHILKTISDLIRSTPYHKLEKGTLLKLVKHVKPFINHKDINVQISALTVFGCSASVTPQLDETRQIIYGHFADSEENAGKPWLFETCLRMLTNAAESNLVLSVECLQVLGALVQNFFYDTVVCYPGEVFRILDFGFSKSDYSIRLYTAKIMETMTVSLQTSLFTDDDAKRTSLPRAAEIWNTLISGPISAVIQSEDKSSLRSRGCECIANIGVINNDSQSSIIFDEISRANQIICLTHLFGCVKDEAPPVRGTAIRALAVFILFPSLRQDFLFFLDTVDAFFQSAKDENQNVRAQASWLYGNLTEAALANSDEGIDEDGVLEEDLLVKLIDTGVQLAKDTPKVKPNAVRGIGNILKIVSQEFIQNQREKVKFAVDILLKNASTGSFMKSRWNSCYALANALSNPSVCSHVKGDVFPVLSDLVQNYKNFKVRISAGCAISSLKNRSDYGEFYLPIWSALQTALENTENITDFSEYQHRDQLVDQICMTMCHLISLVTVPDFIPLQDLLVHRLDAIHRHLLKFKDRTIPEKSSVILNADARLGELIDSVFNEEQKNAFSVISNIFLTDRY